jgi:hypothetical protein
MVNSASNIGKGHVGKRWWTFFGAGVLPDAVLDLPFDWYMGQLQININAVLKIKLNSPFHENFDTILVSISKCGRNRMDGLDSYSSPLC